MSIYADRVFPSLMNFVMDREPFRELRREVLKDLEGVVLEIGFGTGLNLPLLSKSCTKNHRGRSCKIQRELRHLGKHFFS